MDIRTTLNERGTTHGDFTDNARIAQAIKAILYAAPHYDKRTDVEREAMDMIAHKLARWVSSPNYWNDNAVDIAGYATLVVDRLSTPPHSRNTD